MNRHIRSKYLKTILNYNILFKEYIIKELSSYKIANKYNCSKEVILKYLKQYNIPCRNKSESQIGKIVTNQTKELQSMAHKGKISNFKNKTHSGNTRKLISKSLQGKYGKLSRNWIDGRSFIPYSVLFNSKLKYKIRIRDNFKCQNCGVKEKNCYRNLDIHHIDYNKDNCNENNLITLCSPCNGKANGNRDYWYSYYKYIMEEK